jgi:hypothetical protein
LVLTGVGERGGGGAGEVARPRRGAGSLEDGVEGVGRVRGEGVGEVAEAAGLNGRAVGAPRGPARVVQRRLQRLLRGAAPRDAPRRRPRRRHEHQQRRQQRHGDQPRRRVEPPHVVGEGRERGKVVGREFGDGGGRWLGNTGEKSRRGARERISSSRSLLPADESFYPLSLSLSGRVFRFTFQESMILDWGLTAYY